MIYDTSVEQFIILIGTDIYKALDVALNLIQANQTEPKNDAGVVDFSNGTETKTCKLRKSLFNI